MSQVSTILWAKRRMARHSIASIRSESKLKIIVVFSAAILLWWGVFKALAIGFEYLQLEAFADVARAGEVSLADLLMARLLSVFAFALFFMLIFSNILVTFSTLYKAREVQYLFQAPIPVSKLYLTRLMECISMSSWASAYLGSPLILAYGISTDAHPGYYAVAILYYVPFVTIPAAIGSICTILLVRIFPKLPRFVLVGLSIFVIIVFFINIRDTFNTQRLAEDTVMGSILTATQQTQSSLLPSAWASQGILSASQNRFGEAGYNFLLILSNALMLTLVASWLAKNLFATGFSALLGSEYARPRPLGKGILGRLEQYFPPIRNPYRALIIKDIKLFWRDPVQWTQFVIFFGIMAVYIANISNSSMEMQTPWYRAWIASLNTAASTLVLASLTSRFVYPLVSLEGFRFWILGLAPLTRKQLIWQKYWLAVCTTTPFTVGLTILTALSLEVTNLQFIVSIYSILLANLALAGLAVGLGALYPNFQEDNPSRIVSGMGGTLNFLLSVGYISLIAITQTQVLLWYAVTEGNVGSEFWQALVWIVFFTTFISLMAALIPMHLGLKNLNRTEF